MAASDLVIVNDIVGRGIYTNLTSQTSLQFGSAYQGDSYNIKYYPVVPSGNLLAPWTKVDISQVTLKMGIGPRDGTEARLVSQDVWNKQIGPDSTGAQGYLYATFDLNTDALNTAIGSLDSYSSIFEIQFGEGGKYRCGFQTAINITPVVIGPTGTASLPAPAAQYYTKTEMDALFQKFILGPGQTTTFTSPDGTRQRIIGVRNDGSPQDDTL